MRQLLTTLALSLVLGGSVSLPASASHGDHAANRGIGEPSGAPHIGSQAPAGQPYRVRLARAAFSDAEEASTRLRRRPAYDRYDGGYRPRYTKRRHVRGIRHAHRHQRAAQRRAAARRHAAAQRRAAARRHAAAQRRAAAGRAARAAWAKRSLSTSGAGHGIASYYWQPQRVAAGGWFDPNAMTAAHKTLPFGTKVRVTHLGNGRTVDVKINDRGPYVAGRIIDLSKAAAALLGMTQQGIARVKVEVLGR